MASSGNKSVSFTSWNSLRFSWEQKSQSIPNNNTIISWKLELISGTDGRIVSGTAKAWTVVVNGTKYTGTANVAIGNNTTKTLASGETTIVHNSDGSKVFSYSFTQVFEITFSGDWIGEVSGSGSGTLNTISRASQPSLVTWPNTTQNVGDFGQEFSIHMNRASADFTHTVRYEYGSRKGTIATGVGTGTTWTVPLDFMNDIPNATSGSGRIYVDTYKGSTLIGTKYTGFTATVPASVVPTASSLSGKDLNSVHGFSIQGISRIQIKVDGITPAYGSPVSCEIAFDNVRYQGTDITTNVVRNTGTLNAIIVLKDSRGRQQHYTLPITVKAYTAPQVTSLSVHRCNADGTTNDQGSYIKAIFSAKITQLSTATVDAARYVFKYKKTTADTWTEVPLTGWNNAYSVNSREQIFPADDGSTYDVAVSATDRYLTSTRATSASTAFSLMDWHPSGRGIAFGGVAQKENTMEIRLDAEFFGQVKGTIFDAIYPVGSIYMAYNHVDPSTLFGGTWVRMQDGFLWASRPTDTIGQTGGEKTVTLTEAQLPSHSHGSVYSQHATGTKSQAWYTTAGSSLAYGTVATGGGQAHNNMPPYIQVSMWRRTA